MAYAAAAMVAHAITRMDEALFGCDECAIEAAKEADQRAERSAMALVELEARRCMASEVRANQMIQRFEQSLQQLRAAAASIPTKHRVQTIYPVASASLTYLSEAQISDAADKYVAMLPSMQNALVEQQQRVEAASSASAPCS